MWVDGVSAGDMGIIAWLPARSAAVAHVLPAFLLAQILPALRFLQLTA